MIDHMEDFRRHLAGFGLGPGEIRPDGKIHRFRVGEKRNPNAWYVFFGDGEHAGAAFGDWSQGLSETWTSRSVARMDPEARRRFQEDLAARRGRIEAEEREAQAKAAERARALWAAAKPVAGHPYLAAKGIQGRMLRQCSGPGFLGQFPV